jgi:hypothetical protein
MGLVLANCIQHPLCVSVCPCLLSLPVPPMCVCLPVPPMFARASYVCLFARASYVCPCLLCLPVPPMLRRQHCRGAGAITPAAAAAALLCRTRGCSRRRRCQEEASKEEGQKNIRTLNSCSLRALMKAGWVTCFLHWKGEGRIMHALTRAFDLSFEWCQTALIC